MLVCLEWKCVIGIGSVEPTHGCTSFSRHVLVPANFVFFLVAAEVGATSEMSRAVLQVFEEYQKAARLQPAHGIAPRVCAIRR